MPTNGLLTEVRWEWYGTELSADEAVSQTVLSVVNASELGLNQDIWIGAEGPYTITAIDFDNDTITVSPALGSSFDAGTEVVPDVGGQPGQLWVAEVVLPDAEETIEVPLTVTDLLSMPEGTYTPPPVVVISDDMERIIDLPGSLPNVATTLIPDLPPVDDGSIPNPPTLLDFTQSLFLDPSGQNFILANVTWSDPIENTDTTPLTDLASIEIQRKINSEPWGFIGVEDPGVETSSGGVLPQNATVQYRARAVDSYGNTSTWALSPSDTTDTDTGPPGQPSTPTVTAPLSTLKIVWDGLLNGGGALDVDYLFTEVHVSTTNNFTPSTGTQVGTLRGKGTFLFNGLTAGTPYYVKLINVDRTGNKSAASVQGSATATPTQLLSAEIADSAISAAKLADNAVTTPKINPEAVTTEKLTVAGFSENLAPNGGMEELSAADNTKPANWGIYTVTTVSAWGTDASNFNSGSRGAYFTLPSQTDNGRLYLTRPIPVNPADTFYIAAMVKQSRAVPNSARLEIWTSATKATVTNPTDGGTTVTQAVATETGSTSWHLREGAATVPAGHTWMVVAVRSNAANDGSGSTVYVDDVTVRKLIGDALIVNLTASKITAGELTADVLLSGKFYTDVSPNARMEMDGLGLRAYDETNMQTIEISSLDGVGTFQGIQIYGVSNFGTNDPTTGETGALISPDGNASFQELFSSKLYVNGVDVQAFLAEIGQGVIARSTKELANNKTATGNNAEVDLYEISADCVAGRVYRVSVDPATAEFNAGTESGGFRLRWTTDNSRPTSASALFGNGLTRAPADADAADVTIQFSKTFVASTTNTHRWLVQLCHSSPGAGDYVRLPSGREVRVIVEDLGTEPPDTGINPGASLSQTKTFSYAFSWSAYYDYTTGTKLGDGKIYVRGRDVNRLKYGLFGFTTVGQAAIQADLAGYTMNYVQLSLYPDTVLYAFSNYSTEPYQPWHSKASVQLHAHALTDNAAPATGPTSPSVASPLLGGLENWKTGARSVKDLPLSYGNNLRDGTATGLLLTTPDLSPYSYGPDYIEEWTAWGANNATKYPYLIINATKY